MRGGYGIAASHVTLASGDDTALNFPRKIE